MSEDPKQQLTRRNTGSLEAQPPNPNTRTVRIEPEVVETEAPNPALPRANTSGTTGSHSIGGLGIRRRTTELFQPAKKLARAPTYTQSFKNAFLSSWINVLLVFIPVSWATHFAGVGDTLVFIFSFLAIIPLASLLSFATEELALRVGQTLGGLLNATLGNAVELIVAILALIKCELQIVQSSLVGSILSNMLLVLGMCFFVGGTKYSEQQVMTMSAQLNSSLLVMAVFAILVPAAFNAAYKSGGTGLDLEKEKVELLQMSRGVAVILVVIYMAYLVFQLWSHAHLYNDIEGPTGSTQYPDTVKAGVRNIRRFGRSKKVDENDKGALARSESTTEVEGSEREEEGEEEPQLNFPVTIILLAGTTVIVGVTAEWLVSSIDGLTAANPSLSQEWVGLILLPIVGNAAEHVTAVTVARKDKLDLSMGVAIGSSIQIALFVIPFLVLLAWWIGKPLTMLFDPFESIVLFLSVIMVNSTLSDARSNWLEGFLLMSVYIIIAVALWYYPGTDSLITC